jgi:hypothetical protein
MRVTIKPLAPTLNSRHLINNKLPFQSGCDAKPQPD